MLFHKTEEWKANHHIATSENALQIDRAKGKFQSLFQSLFLASSLRLDVCYDEYCPSLQEKNAEGERIIERRSCKICKLYHSTIAAMKEHKRVCKRSNKPRAVESSDESDAEDVTKQRKILNLNNLL